MSLITKHTISWAALGAALNHPGRIAGAFLWEDTFQGYAFWHNFANEKTTPEKTEEIKALLRLELILHKGGIISVTQQQLEELL